MKAGVSPVVVSRVLHNKAQSIRVSEATSERVRQAAAELGYRCNVAARNFRARQTMNIGVLHGLGTLRPTFSQGSRYFAALMDGITEGAFRHGYSVTLCPKLLGQSPEDAMSDGRFDGLVWYSSVSTDENISALAGCSVPLVLLHTSSSQFGGRHPSVVCDNHQGMRLAVGHLAELGHRRIAFAMEVHPVISESVVRCDEFLAAMKERGLRSEDSIVQVGWNWDGIDEYLASGPHHTAIIAENDGVASEFVARAQARGLKVPDHLSVIGFDSTDFCWESRPALTSVRQPLTEMGSFAIDQLVAHINNDLSNDLETVFPVTLDVRESTGPVQRGAIL